MYIESISQIAPDALALRPISPVRDQRPMGLRQRPQPTPVAVDTKDVTAEIQKSLGELNQAIEPFSVSLKFSRDEETGKTVIKMIDNKSGTTLHQFPEEAMLHVAAVLGKLQGKIFNRKA